MTQRLFLGKPGEITFTGDFHEIVVGDPQPGAPLLLRYDPHRIIPRKEPYRFGDPERPVIAHVLFRAGAPVFEVALHCTAGIIACPDVDPTGQGSMLSARLVIPADADLLVVWFSYDSASGVRFYDSDNGANYRFGFPGRELDRLAAAVERLPDAPFDRFQVSADAVSSVEAVRVPYVLVADRDCIKHELHLDRTGQADTHREAGRWGASIDVPHGAIVRFKVCHWVGGRRLIDDNGSAWYLAPAAEPDRTPSPPSELLDAAAAWR